MTPTHKINKICILTNYIEVTSRGSLTMHKLSTHEGKRYPCDSCHHQETKKETLLNIIY